MKFYVCKTQTPSQDERMGKEKLILKDLEHLNLERHLARKRDNLFTAP